MCLPPDDRVPPGKIGMESMNRTDLFLECYKYDPLQKSYMWMRRIGSLVLMVLGVLVALGSFYIQIIRDNQFYPVPTFFSTVFVIFTVLYFIIGFNLTSDICLDKEYLYVDFFFKRKRARLDDIMEVKKVLTPTFRKKSAFVILFREGLTPFHRFYGWIFGRSFYPGVYVNGSISDRHKLERSLKLKAF